MTSQMLLSDETSNGLLFTQFDQILLVVQKLRARDGDAGERSAKAKLNEQRDGGRMSSRQQNRAQSHVDAVAHCPEISQ